MSLRNSDVITSGLVFSYDMNNTKSWTGKPTTNYAYHVNARADSSYTTYSATGSGTWNAKHSDAINAYNIDGSDITGYVNTGVGDWTNTYHAIWTYDHELRKPVVTMRDIDGQWKAKSFGLTTSTPAGMGLSIGSTYSISWLSWTDDISKCANAGMYMRRASDGSYNFWDGQSNSQATALNTKPRTWQRVYAVYTVNSGADINASWSCYMYGHYGNRGTVKIADVQIEAGPPSAFSRSLTRSTTQSLLDLTGQSTITVNSLTYNSDGTFSFNGSNYATISTFNNKPTTAITCEAWIFPTRSGVGTGTIRGGALSSSNSMYLGIIDSSDGGTTFSMHWANQTSNSRLYNWNGTIPNNAWSHLVGTYDGSMTRAYLNGVEIWSAAQTGTIPDASYGIGYYIPSGMDGTHPFIGKLGNSKIYNRALSAAEVKQNFNALRGRYGI